AVSQQKPATPTQPHNTAASESPDPAPKRSTDSTAVPNHPSPSSDNNAPPMHRAREQRRQQAQPRPEPPATTIAHIDHTFALLMIMFAAIAIAGPALHLVERRPRRQ